MTWDWSRSGRVDDFEFQLIDVSSINNTPKIFTGVTGGQLNFNYDSSEKVSGSISVTQMRPITNKLIRIFYCPSLAGEASKRIELGTFFASTERGHYEDGMYSGDIELHSPLARWIDDKLATNLTFKKGASILGYFKWMFKAYGGSYKISGIGDKKMTGTRVFERGTNLMEVMQWFADTFNAMINCTTHGETLLERYVPPANKAVTMVLPRGEQSVTMPGVDITSTQADAKNRVSVKFEYTTTVKKKSVQKILQATAANSGALKTDGRYKTETYDLTSLSPKTDAKIKQIAQSKLKGLNSHNVIYRLKTISYLPITTGNVVDFYYDDIKVRGIVRALDVSFEPGFPMTIEIKKIKELK